MEGLTEQENLLRRLTTREVAVLLHLCKGASYDQIGHELSMARRTVSYHTSVIYDKLGLTKISRAARQRELGKFCQALDSIEGRLRLMDFHVIPYDSDGKIMLEEVRRNVSGLEVRITLDRPYGAVKDVIDRVPLGTYTKVVPIRGEQPSDHWFELRGDMYAADSKGTFLAALRLFEAPGSTEVLVENRNAGLWWGSTKGAVAAFTKSLCEALLLRGYITEFQSSRILTEFDKYSQ